MLLLTFLLFPVVLADVRKRMMNNYLVEIDGSTLKSVKPTETSSHVLDLSGLHLQVLEKNVFDNLGSLKSLNLGNNSLSSIPNGLFSKLGSLEHLSLADNNITKFEKSFKGLDHLKSLNISNNPLTNFEGADFAGLPKTSVVFTKGLSIASMNAYAFEKEPGNPFAYNADEDEDDDDDDNEDEDEDVDGDEDNDEEDDAGVSDNKVDNADVGNKERSTIEAQSKNVTSAMPESRRKREVETCHQIKVCIHDDVLKMVALLNQNETLPSDCQTINMEKYSNYLPLKDLGIAKFEKGWYQLDKTVWPIQRLDLSGNDIVEVTKELMNDLPSNIDRIYLSRNKIERLRKGIIENSYIRELTLDSNRISEIEADALANLPVLHQLHLNDNLLTDTQFVASLPKGIWNMFLQKNRITEITPGSFSRISELNFLNLDENLIQEVKSNSFRGLFNLMEIRLANNCISKIEPGSFQGINLNTLVISNNSITSFERDVFDHRPRLTYLDISHNKFSNIKKDFPDGFSSDLRSLQLNFNEIEKLERGNFEHLPNLFYLSLSGNKISEIEPETFDLPRLIKLFLGKNQLYKIDVDSFHGLKLLEMLYLNDNHITSVPEGFVKDMPRLVELELSNNPIKRLQNGALYGFRRKPYSVVHLNNVPIEVIETGLFDDM